MPDVAPIFNAQFLDAGVALRSPESYRFSRLMLR
jgi:hypothetical protein